MKWKTIGKIINDPQTSSLRKSIRLKTTIKAIQKWKRESIDVGVGSFRV